MDPITHGFSGILISRTGFYQRWGSAATITFIAGALIPDIDHFTLRLAGPVAYLKYHRGFTHSIIGIIPLALIIAFIVPMFFKQIRGKAEYLTFAGMSALGTGTHIFLDIITSYGTQVFFPFNTSRYSLDLVFIIDPYFSLIFILPPLLWIFMKDRAKMIAFTAIILIAAYLTMAYVFKGIAIHRAEKEAAGMSINPSRVEAVPLPLSPFKWSVFVEDKDKFYQMNVDILRDKISKEAFDKVSAQDDIIKKAETLEVVKIYRWFARFPVITAVELGDDYVIEYYDIRFNSMPPRKPFLLKVVLDKNGSFKEGELSFHSIKP